MSLQGDHAAAEAFLREALSLARGLDDARAVGHTLHNLAHVIHARGDAATARRLLEESVALHRVAGALGNLSVVTLSLAMVAHEQGDAGTARTRASEALALYRQMGNRRKEGLTLADLGSIATTQDDCPAAEAYLRASLAIQQELGDPTGIAFVLERYAGLAVAQAQPALALALAAAAAGLREQAGTPLPPAARARLDGVLRPARQAQGEQAAQAAWDRGRALSPEAAIAEALHQTQPVAAVDQIGRERPRSMVLTRREQDVAALIARGESNRRIAAALGITEGTAASHVLHILNKLGYRSRAQIAVWAADHGLRRSAD